MSRTWRGVGLAPLAMLALGVAHLAVGRVFYGLELAFTSGFVTAALLIGRTLRRRSGTTGGVPSLGTAAIVLFALLLGVSAISAWTYALTWNKDRMDGYFFTPSPATSVDVLIRGAELVHGEGRRNWIVPGGREPVAVRLTGRLVSARAAAAWSGTPGATVSVDDDVARLAVGGAPDYALLSVPTAGRLGDRTFAARFEVKAAPGASRDSPARAVETASAWLMAWGDAAASSEAARIEPTDAWSEVRVRWRVPLSVDATTLRFLVRGDRDLLVRDVTIAEIVAGVAVPPLSLGVSWSGAADVRALAVASDGSVDATVPIPAPRGRRPRHLTADLIVPPGYALEVTRATPAYAGDGAGLAVPTPFKMQRQRFWAPHPTLAGHVLTAIALAVLALTRRPGRVAMRAVLFGLAVASVWTTGSDAAVATASIGGALLMVPRGMSSRFGMRGGIIVAVAVALAVGVGTVRYADRLLSDFVNRVDAWRPFLECVTPLRAWPAQVCAALAEGHAHNVAIQSLASGGLLELLLIAVMLWALGRPGRRDHGLAVLFGAVVALQIVDYTLLHVGVIVPLAIVSGFVAAGPSPAGDAWVDGDALATPGTGPSGVVDRG